MANDQYPPGAFFKDTQQPKPLKKLLHARDEEAERKRIKKLVFARDGGKCRVCGDTATEMHELQFRSLMGKRSLENSIAVCTIAGAAHNCHRLLQTHAIEVEGDDANKRLIFRWNPRMLNGQAPPFRIKSKRKSQNKDAA